MHRHDRAFAVVTHAGPGGFLEKMKSLRRVLSINVAWNAKRVSSRRERPVQDLAAVQTPAATSTPAPVLPRRRRATGPCRNLDSEPASRA